MGNVVRIPTELRDAKTPFDAIRRTREDGSEFWSARDLMPIMGYVKWDKFLTPIERAMQAAKNQNHDLISHFPRSGKTPVGGGPARQDFRLSRFAAYLVAMNGDPNKAEVAAAQAYFAIQTRVAETAVAEPLSETEIVAQALQITSRQLAEVKGQLAIEQRGKDQISVRRYALRNDLSLESDFVRSMSKTASQHQKSVGRDSYVMDRPVYKGEKGLQGYDVESLDFALASIIKKGKPEWRREPQ